jgi:hypothetical protein
MIFAIRNWIACIAFSRVLESSPKDVSSAAKRAYFLIKFLNGSDIPPNVLKDSGMNSKLLDSHRAAYFFNLSASRFANPSGS